MRAATLLALTLQGCAWIDASDQAAFFDRDGDGLPWGLDCDDADPKRLGAQTFFVDADGDGWGDPAAPTFACQIAPGLSFDRRDCDDTDAAVRPDAAERCGDVGDGVDEDCDGGTDDLDPEGAWGAVDWYADADRDGYGAGDPERRCVAPPGRVAATGDCADGDPTVFPGAGERCGPQDDDCDFLVDAADPDLVADTVWYADRDDDGHGDGGDFALGCAPPEGHVTSDDDCDDHDAQAWPGAAEVWYSGVDEACDGGDDFDQDGDGAPVASDCDDLDPAAWPGADEVWYSGVDEACDGGDDFDQDGDGARAAVGGGSDCDDTDAATFPGAEELADGVDTDCDGVDFVCGAVTRRVPEDAASLEAALAEACPGDVVDLAPGDYLTQATVDVRVTIRGVGATLSPASPTAPVLTMRRGTLRDVTVTGGAATGVLIADASAVRIDGVRFVDNVGGDHQGGGLTITRSPLTVVVDCVFEGNVGAEGGGLRVEASDDLVVQRTSFRSNAASGAGGALFLNASADALIDNVVFEANDAGSHGGGAYLWGDGVVVHAVRASGNYAGGSGGALVDEGERTLFRDLVVEGNASEDAAGGALFLGGGQTVAEDLWVVQNEGRGVTIATGGAVTLRRATIEYNGADGLYGNAWGTAPWTVEDAVFRDNGALGVIAGTSGVLRRTRFEGNQGANAAAAYLGGPTLIIEDMTVVDPEVTHSPGAGVYLLAGNIDVQGLTVLRSRADGLKIESSNAFLSGVVVENSLGDGLVAHTDGAVVVEHLTSVGNGGAGVQQFGGTGHLDVNHAVFVGNGVGVDGPVRASWCDLWENTTATGGGAVADCLSEPPGFLTYARHLAPELRDLHLAPGSALRDAGDPAKADADGTRRDLGAYGGVLDALSASAWYADLDGDGMFDGWERANGLSDRVDDRAGDLDFDGVSNGVEFAHGTDPERDDTDGDGRSDATEIAEGTDPVDPTRP